MEKQIKELLTVSQADKFQTVAELKEKSQPSGMFYAMLVLSSVIVAAGVVLSNPSIVIGGMLVTPLLTQILLLALGLTLGDLKMVTRTAIFVAKIVLAIIAGSFAMGLIFGTGSNIIFPNLVDTLGGAFLYFIVALASGMAVTLAWIRREVSEVLPGVAIAVALVPPLSYIGVGIAKWNFEVASFFLVIFILNLFGIILGSLGVFSLSQFTRSQSTNNYQASVPQTSYEE